MVNRHFDVSNSQKRWCVAAYCCSQVETVAPGQPLGRHMQPTACDYYSLRSSEQAAHERYSWWADEQRPAEFIKVQTSLVYLFIIL